MSQKELNKTFMMISNLKKPFGLQVFFRKIQCFKGKAQSLETAVDAMSTLRFQCRRN